MSRVEEHPFKIDSITKSEPPQGWDGTGWHRYVITQGTNTIVGHRRGSLRAVRLAVKEIVVRLNERRVGKTGRVNLTPSPKKRV